MPPRVAKGARGKTGPPIKKEEATKDPQYLAPKDAALLAQVFAQYEDKKYGASVKTADIILKKYPDHARKSLLLRPGHAEVANRARNLYKGLISYSSLASQKPCA